MEVLDRKKQPIAGDIGYISFEMPKQVSLDNQSQLFSYNDADSEVVKIEFQFPAGSAFSSGRLEADFTNKLIASGTSTMTEKVISEKLDYYGAYFEKQVAKDDASFSVYSLRKFAPEVIKIVSEVLHDPIFPEQEVETLKNIRKQKFLVKCEKVSFLARRTFSNAIFSEDHPYGGQTEVIDFDRIQREDLLKFHKEFYLSKPDIYVAGKVDDELIKILNTEFGKDEFEMTGVGKQFFDPAMNTDRILIEKKGAVQSAIRIGRLMFNRTHKDYPAMQVLNTVLGGYFGSRLMSNLREDKGFTYGVGSGLASLLHGGYFFISTEVGADTTKLAEQEILFEMKKLREEKIPTPELDLVKNYLLGQILKSTDGVFARMARFKSLHHFSQGIDDFNNLTHQIRNVQADKLQDLANQWFKEEEMLTVIAGNTD